MFIAVSVCVVIHILFYSIDLHIFGECELSCVGNH